MENKKETEVEKEEVASYDTAFIIIRAFDGSFYVTNQLDVKFTVERKANRNDMRQGFRELLETMAADQVIQGVLAKMAQSSSENSQPNEPEIRQSLPEEEAQ